MTIPPANTPDTGLHFCLTHISSIVFPAGINHPPLPSNLLYHAAYPKFLGRLTCIPETQKIPGKLPTCMFHLIKTETINGQIDSASIISRMQNFLKTHLLLEGCPVLLNAEAPELTLLPAHMVAISYGSPFTQWEDQKPGQPLQPHTISGTILQIPDLKPAPIESTIEGHEIIKTLNIFISRLAHEHLIQIEAWKRTRGELPDTNPKPPPPEYMKKFIIRYMDTSDYKALHDPKLQPQSLLAWNQLADQTKKNHPHLQEKTLDGGAFLQWLAKTKKSLSLDSQIQFLSPSDTLPHKQP